MHRALVLLAFAVLAVPALAQPEGAVTHLVNGLAFAENRGQWPGEVLFSARLGDATAWVTAYGVVLDFYEVEREGRAGDGNGALETTRRGHVVAMRFEGARARRATGHGRRDGYHHYFLGADPARWATRVPRYGEVVLEGLYDGVDLRLHIDDGRLRYDLVVAPGADPSQVRMRMEGAGGVGLTAEGALRMETALGPVEHRGLLAYQEGPAGRRDVVASAFRVGPDGAVSFDVGGADPARALVIDPLIWATFLGGGSGEEGRAVASDAGGRATIAGTTRSADFPTTPGAYDTSYNGGTLLGGDAYVARLSPDGASLEYATFLGGSNSDLATAVALDADGSAVVVGSTSSVDFPTTPGAFDTSYNGSSDSFVTRLSPDGTALLFSTFLGGTLSEPAYDVALGADGSATVVGVTRSSDFPTTPGAFDTSYNGGPFDAYVARLSPDGTALLFSTFLGGTNNDQAYGVAVGTDGSTVVVGGTESSVDFPTTPGAFDTSYNGSSDAYVARLSPDGTTLLFSTFLGGPQAERARAVALRPEGPVVVTGETFGSGFPSTPGSFSPLPNGNNDVFVVQLAADGSALLWGTFLGGMHGERSADLALGGDGSVIVAGATLSPNFPTPHGAFDTTHNGVWDAFLARLSADGSNLLYGTYLGGRNTDEAFGVALSGDGNAVVVGTTSSVDFPATPGAYDTSYDGGFTSDAFVARVDVVLSPLALTATPLNSPVPRGSDLQLTVAFTNNTDDVFSGDLVLEVEHQSGLSRTRALARNFALAPGQTMPPVFALRVPQRAPLGLYHATVTALEGGTAPVAESAFAFRVTLPTEAPAAARGAPWSVTLLDDGGLFTVAPPAERAPATTAQRAATAAWPNPTSGATTVAFSLDASAAVRLGLYDVLGREVATVDAGRLAPGTHHLGLDLSALPAGVYVWRLAVGDRVETDRLTVAR